MAARANYVKIGLFVTIGLVAAAALAITVGALTLHRKEVTSYFTYFNEAVTGLDVGAPVKARGVNVGQVGDITFAPDRKMVEVRMDMDERTLRHLGLHQDHFVVPAELRAQLASQGLTGSAFVSIDVFDPEKNPPPALTFVAPERYIPAATSELKSLEESVFRAMDGIASLAIRCRVTGSPRRRHRFWRAPTTCWPASTSSSRASIVRTSRSARRGRSRSFVPPSAR